MTTVICLSWGTFVPMINLPSGVQRLVRLIRSRSAKGAFYACKQSRHFDTHGFQHDYPFGCVDCRPSAVERQS
jgi:hypothetical protein